MRILNLIHRWNNGEKKIEIIFAFITAIISVLFVMLYMHNTVIEPRATIELLTTFKAHLPFQERILSVLIVKYIPMKIFLTITTIGIIYTLRYLLKYFEIENPFLSLIVILPMFANYFGFGSPNIIYSYDFMAILLSLLAIIAIVRGKIIWFYIFYVLALLNRETGAFLSVAFIFCFIYIYTWKKLLINFLIQISIFIIIRSVLIYLFSQNPGGLIEWKLWPNINLILHPNWHLILSILSVFCGFWVFPIVFFYKLNSTLKRLVLVVPVILISLFFVGNLTEFRIYSEATSIITLSAVYLINDFYYKKDKVVIE